MPIQSHYDDRLTGLRRRADQRFMQVFSSRRLDLGISRDELARNSVGIVRLDKIELESHRPGYGECALICRALGLSFVEMAKEIEALPGWSGKPKNSIIPPTRVRESREGDIRA